MSIESSSSDMISTVPKKQIEASGASAAAGGHEFAGRGIVWAGAQQLAGLAARSSCVVMPALILSSHLVSPVRCIRWPS